VCSSDLAATEPLRGALVRVARHLAASPDTAWWSTPLVEHCQWTVEWEDEPTPQVAADPHAGLQRAREALIDGERQAQRERPADPTVNWGGEWWVGPTSEIPATTRALADGSPVGLWCVEDSTGWEHADSVRLGSPAGLRMYEIDSPQAWARLCARF